MNKIHNKDSFIEGIIQLCKVQLANHLPEQNFSHLSVFIKQFYHHADVEYLKKTVKHHGAEILISRALRAWQLLQHRPSYAPVIDFYEKPVDLSKPDLVVPLTITLICQDRPFLVDSLKIFLEHNGFEAEMILHPILKVVRDSHGHLLSLETAKGHLGEENIIPIASKVQIESLVCIILKDGKDEEHQHRLHQTITHLLRQIAFVVDDFDMMKSHILELGHRYESFDENLQYLGPDNHSYTVKDTGLFLSWLTQDNFIFLGCRYFASRAQINQFSLMKDEDNNECFSLRFESVVDGDIFEKGLFKDPGFSRLSDLTPTVCHSGILSSVQKKEPQISHGSKVPVFLIAKKSKYSPIHRHSRLNSIEVLDIDHNGTICGLYQFIGLFSRQFFNHSAFDIPLLKHKIKTVFDRFGLSPKWHDGKYLMSILKSVPQDEIFQFKEEELCHLCDEILEIHNNKDLYVVLRPDAYGLSLSVLIYLPKEKYSFNLKEKILNFLIQKFGGVISSQHVFMSEFPFARLVVVLSFESAYEFSFNESHLRKKLQELSLSWEEKLDHLVLNSDFKTNYKFAFPEAYKDSLSFEWALKDIKNSLEALDKEDVVFSLDYDESCKKSVLKVFHIQESVPLFFLMPMLQNFGLNVLSELTYEIEAFSYEDSTYRNVWIHYFYFQSERIQEIDKKRISQAFYDVWCERIEDDSLNHLIFKSSFTARDVLIFRAYAKFLRQVEFNYSYELIASVLSYHLSITEKMKELFTVKFTFPYVDHSKAKERHILKELHHQLQAVARNDHDEILRRFLNCIQATVRTNFYLESSAEYLSFKFDCHNLVNLPEPYPDYEIFIYSPFMEACHLRGDKVSRGGIRWSDRYEDFRSEVLGLMKAQMLKNSVIIPLGSKGGFVSKHYEKLQAKGASLNELKQEVVRCYQTMIRGLLSLTDNWLDEKIVHPPQVICHDGNDPYLVVAADKGTASFSDLANGISKEYGFWLDDAFASGGSHGYDHKKMAITAKGAWISIERHFQELGLNFDKTPFSVVGVGDMSGDVFGNGMLRSPFIKLIAAFNHQHIFIDPSPDLEKSFDERRRLFDLPNSTWADYSPSLISKGGGVFARTAKSILLSSEIKRAFGIDDGLSEITPNELIVAILKSKVNLLWFGGIGTFIKSSQESQGDVRDRHNDIIRVDAKDLRAEVIGEGANLAVTQRGRIEFSLKGGKINTDAIDNSAGVDCSDHEVNIKILFSHLLQAQKIEKAERNQFLQVMTGDVVDGVLRDNHRQTLILSLMELRVVDDFESYQLLINYLESDSDMHLNRKIEFIANDEELIRRKDSGKGLTRPELAILLAYSKNSLYKKLMRSIQTLDLSHLDHYFLSYFPKILIEKFSDDLLKHPLKNQILTTVLANEVINRMGPCFLLEVCQIESVSILECAQVYFQVIEMFGFEEIWNEIESLDSENVIKDQYKLFLEVQDIVRRLTHSLLGHKSFVHNREKRQQIHHQILKMLLILYKTKLEIKERPLVSDYNLSQKFDVLKFFPVILELVCQSYSNHTEKRDHLPQITETFFRVRDELSFSLFYDLEAIITADQGWQLITKTKLYNDLIQAEADLAWHVYKEGAYESWLEKYAAAFAQHRKVIGLVQAAMSGPVKPDLGLLIYVIRHIQNLATASSGSVFCENDFSFQTPIESLERTKPSLN